MAVDRSLIFRSSFLQAAAHRVGFDRAVAYGSLARVWGMGSGVVSLLLIAAFFSPEIQGFHYTFMNLIGLQTFAELGLGQVLIQFAAHEWASLRLDENGRVTGDPVAEKRLAGLAHFALRWFLVASIIFLACVQGAGIFVFGKRGAGVDWFWPWTILCCGVVLDLCLLPFWALLEGTNQVSAAYLLRFVRAVISGIALWCAIGLGAGLWSAAISLWAGVVLMGVYGLWRHRSFYLSLFAYPGHLVKGWWAEIWPMQWRIALSWLSGYFVFAFFTPVLFKYYGPVVAGQMGMSWSLIQALSSIAALIIQTKAPMFAMLIAQRKWTELDQRAFRIGLSAIAVAFLGSITLFAVVYGLSHFQFSLSRRLLPLLPFSLFLVGMLAVQVTIPISVYLRAHKREPMMVLSVSVGFLIGLSTIVLGYYYGALGMGAGYATIAIFVVVPWAYLILQRCRAAWHG